jgi:hypothetical protein
MSETLKNLLVGAREALTIKNTADYTKPSRKDIENDPVNFNRDIRKIGGDLRKSANSYLLASK